MSSPQDPGRVPTQPRRKPEPVRRRGTPFFDELVSELYSPHTVRRTLYKLMVEQYKEADRLQKLRGWGNAQPHGNDRYQYSLEQEQELIRALPGSELIRPAGSALYRISQARIYPIRFGHEADDCPTTATIDALSATQASLALGHFSEQQTLFEISPPQKLTVVWLLFTGNRVQSGPLSAYVATADGLLRGNRLKLTNIEPLLKDGDPDSLPLEPPIEAEPSGSTVVPEPTIPLSLKT